MPVIYDSPPRADYTAGAGQTVFSVTWNFFADTDLKVWVDNVEQIANSDYTVSGAGSDTGGTVTFTTPLAGGEHVAIMGDIPIERTTAFIDTGPFDMAGLNDFLERVAAWMLQLEMRMDRMVRLADYVEPKDLELPLALPSGFLTFDINGNLTVSESTPEIDAAVADAQAAQTAAEAAQAAAETAETNAAGSASNAAASATNAQASADDAAASAAALSLPDPAVADTYLRRNEANTAYEARTPAQVRTDIGAITLAEAQAEDANYLPKSGGTMTGDIILPADPDAALKAAPKQYVDSVAAVPCWMTNRAHIGGTEGTVAEWSPMTMSNSDSPHTFAYGVTVNTGSARIEILTTGIYHISASMEADATGGTRFSLGIRKNGSDFILINTNEGTLPRITAQVSGVVSFEAGDYIEYMRWNSGVAIKQSRDGTFFSGALVRTI